MEAPPALPGRLGSPEMLIKDDPRADPRMVAAMAPFGLDVAPGPVPVDANSPIEALLEFCSVAEPGYDLLFDALFADLPAVDGVTSRTEVIKGVDDNDITLYIHRLTNAEGPLPCIVHAHGGGMVILKASGASYVRWRDELAATGMVVIGVEFRNGGGALGDHPFPAGLNDCASGVRWAFENRERLGISKIVVSGEVGRWQPLGRDSVEGEGGGLDRRDRRHLLPVPLHLQRVGRQDTRLAVAVRERRLLVKRQRDGRTGKGLRPGRREREQSVVLAICRRDRGPRWPAAARHLGQSTRSTEGRGASVLPEVAGCRCQRDQPDRQRHLSCGATASSDAPCQRSTPPRSATSTGSPIRSSGGAAA